MTPKQIKTQRNRLYVSTGTGWAFVENYPTYQEAVRKGQEIAPHNFNIDTGSRVPTREEQLLIEPRVPVSAVTKRRNSILASL